MRLRVVLGIAAVALCLAPVARASSFPDLPGMSSAEKATEGRGAEVSGAESAPTATQDERPVAKAPKETSTQETSSITDLPGGGAIPVLGGKVKAGLTSNSTVADNAGLIVLAGLGSFAALAWLFYLRRAGVL